MFSKSALAGSRLARAVIETLEERALLSFSVGERVQTIGDTTSRSSATTSASAYGIIPAGQLGTVQQGPSFSDGFEWYRVDWDAYNYAQSDGWSAGGSPRFVTAAVSAPAVTGVSPNPVTGSNSAQNFTVSGSSFASGAVVRLKDLTNGGTYDKTPVSSGSGQLTISANFTTAQATWSAQVVNPGGVVSNVVNFTVNAPTVIPSISGVTDPVTGSNSTQNFVVNGSSFVAGSIVRLKDLTNGGTYDKTPISTSGSQLSISANFTTAQATWSAQVINPGGSSSNVVNFTVTAPTVTPSISGVTNPVIGSSVAQNFVVSGASFVAGSIVRLKDLTNGGTFDKTPTSASGSQLVVSANFTTAQATWSAQVINPGGVGSNVVSFTVVAPAVTPVISSVTNPVTGSNSSQNFTVSGSSFSAGAIVRLQDLTNGGTYDKTPISSSAGQLVISANFTTAQATWSAQVINAGGAASNVATFTVNAPAASPAISAVSPNPVGGSNVAQNFTVNGSNFSAGAIVRLKDLTNGGTFDKTPTSVTATQLVISANFTTAQATWSAQVINAGGAGSNVVTFTVSAPAATPSISGVSPNPVMGSATAQNFIVTGGSFAAGAIVRLRDLTNGGTFDKTPVSATGTQLMVSANFTAAQAAWSAQVINPGGAASNLVNFTVNAPQVTTPTVTVTSPNGGEAVQAGATRTISWSVAGDTSRISYFKVALSTDGGATFANITETTIAASARAYAWAVPSTLRSESLRVRVRAIDANANFAVVAFDASDSNFSAVGSAATPTVGGVTPNPVSGSNVAQSITVTGSGFGPGAIVRLKDLTNGGTFDKTPVSASSTQLVISANVTTAAATWSAQVLNPGGVGSNTVSFSVIAPNTAVPVVTVSSPNGGEAWQAGTTRTITWAVSGTTTNISYFKVAYSTDGGATYANITENTVSPAARSFSWTLPSALNSTQVRVRVRALDAGANILTFDTSNANFAVQPAVTVGDWDDQITEAKQLPFLSLAAAPPPLRAVNGTIDSATDVDLYYFVVGTPGQRWEFDLDRASGSGLDSHLRLFGTTGLPLSGGSNDNGAAPGEVLGSESFLSYTFAEPGKYFIGVSGAGNNAYSAMTGQGDSAGSLGGYRLYAAPGGYSAGQVRAPSPLPTGYSPPAVDVTLRRIGDGANARIVNRPTWILIHGRADSQESFGGLASAVNAFATDDQVLTLDWRGAAADNNPASVGLQGAGWIPNIAAWTVAAIKALGISGSNVRLVGHSWGSFLAYDIAKGLGKVQSIVALDPAQEGLGGYPDATVNFRSVSSNSWAFYGNGIYGSAVKSGTAHEAFALDYEGWDPGPSGAHTAPVRLFESIVRRNGLDGAPTRASWFSLNRLLTSPQGRLWKPDAYTRGSAVESVVPPLFEGIFRLKNTDGSADWGSSWSEVMSFKYRDLSGVERLI